MKKVLWTYPSDSSSKYCININLIKMTAGHNGVKY